MSPGNQAHSANGQQTGAGVSLDDIYFTLFRHKWLILGFIGLGIVGAAALRVVHPPLYKSKGELMVLYVNDIKPGITSSNEDVQYMPTDPMGQAVVNSETEIIKSLDVAKQVVDEIGADRILAELGGGTNRNAAIAAVASGIDVETPPKTAILTVSFKHRDRDLVQPLLAVLLKVYQRRHLEVREKVQERDEYYTAERDKLSREISKIDLDLKELKAQVQVINPEEAKRDYQSRIEKAKDDLMLAQRDLEEHELMLNTAPGAVHPTEGSVPEDTMASYNEVITDLGGYLRHKRDLIRDGLLEAHPALLRVQERIQVLQKQKNDLEAKFPALKQLALVSRGSGTNAEPASSRGLDDFQALNAKVGAREMVLSNLQAEATRVLEIEPTLRKLERERDEDQRKYDSIVSRMSSTLGGELHGAGPLINMSEVQSPTGPVKDMQQFYKLIGIVFGGCTGLGLGLAFLFDLVIDRTIRRSRDVEKHLRLPVFLAIPDSAWLTGLRWPWKANGTKALLATGNRTAANGAEQASAALAPWKPDSPMKTHAEGLRERLLTYFEVHNLNLKKPKLVAVTSCTRGAGVTTLASGLAAELSKTGDGNVLYLDMHGELGAAHPFRNGKPGPGLADVLDPEGRTGAQVEEKLYLACLENGDGKTEQQRHTRFNQLVPKLKASDYDYIIFDMPMVSATSPTPRLAAHMDIVLMVLESEKTGQQVAARAAALMREARANVATVLNKCRPYVPARLSQDM